MNIQKNSRQIPSNEKYTADKGYSDLLYGYLQHISLLDKKTGMRYILKKNIKYVRIAQELNLSRQTVSKKFNNLIERGLLFFEEENQRYILITLDSNLATLLPDDTVRILYNTLQERCLSVLAYLLKTFIQHNENSCEINIDIIKSFVGLNINNRGSNNQVIKDIFMVLKKLGFISYHTEKTIDEETGGMKTRYILDYVNNAINFI